MSGSLCLRAAVPSQHWGGSWTSWPSTPCWSVGQGRLAVTQADNEDALVQSYSEINFSTAVQLLYKAVLLASSW